MFSLASGVFYHLNLFSFQASVSKYLRSKPPASSGDINLTTNMSANDLSNNEAKISYHKTFSFESVYERMRLQDDMVRRLEALERENRELRRMVSNVLDEDKKD